MKRFPPMLFGIVLGVLAMPAAVRADAYKSKLDQASIDALISFIRTLKK